MGSEEDFRRTGTMRLLRALVEASDRVMRATECRIRTYGISCSEFDCLVTLGVDEPLRMCELAERSLLTKSHTTHVVKQLEQRGLARRARSPESDREVLASLTPAGKALFRRIYPAHYRFLRELFDSRLSAGEQEEATRLLRRLADTRLPGAYAACPERGDPHEA